MKTKTWITVGLQQKVEMYPYVSDVLQKGKRVFLGFFHVLRSLGPLLCCRKEVIGRSIPRAASCVSLLEGWSGSCPQRLLGPLSSWIFLLIVIIAQKGNAGRAFGSTRGTRSSIVFTIVRNNELVVVI